MNKQVKESLKFSYEQHPFLLQAERQDTPQSRTDNTTTHRNKKATVEHQRPPEILPIADLE